VFSKKKETDKNTYDSCFTVSLKDIFLFDSKPSRGFSQMRSENNATVVFSKKKRKGNHEKLTIPASRPL
jgi:hypothetical protein